MTVNGYPSTGGVASAIDWLYQATPEQFAAVQRVMAAADVCTTVHTSDLRFATPAELRQSVPPEPDWLWHGFTARGAVTLLPGKPKVGKSTLAWAVARAMTSDAGTFLGRVVTPGPVVYVTEESASTLLHKLPAADPVLHILTRDAAWPRPSWPDLVAAAVSHAVDVGAVLLVVDTLPYWAAMPAEREKDAGAAQEAMEPLLEATSAGLGVLLPTHTRKAGGDDGDAIRGSTAFAGAADIIVELGRPTGTAEPRHRTLTALSRYPQTPAALVIDHDPATGAFGLVAEGTDRRDLRAQADRRELLDMLPDVEPGLSRQELEEALGAPFAQFSPVLKQLQTEGKVRRTGAGRKGNPYRFQKVCHDFAHQAHTSPPVLVEVSDVYPVRDTSETDADVCRADEIEFARQRALIEDAA